MAWHEPLVLVTPGGGQDGYDVVDACVKGLLALPPEQRPRTHIVCGPEMGAAPRAAIAQAALNLPQVSLQDFSDDMMSLMAASDVVVSMGGYNTVCELLTLRKRAIVVPRARPGVEQTIRTQRMARLGLLRAIDPSTLSPALLMGAIQDELAAHARGEERAHLNGMKGLDEVSQALLEWLDLDTSVLRKGRTPTLTAASAVHRERPASFISMEKSWHTPIPPPVGTLAC